MIEQDPSLKDAASVINVLNKESGILGVSGISSDMRDIEDGMARGDEIAILAHNVFVDRIKKFIGQYFAVLNGADAIVFTAGMGENSDILRRDVVEGLSWFGMKIDPSKNVRDYTGDISTPESTVKVLVIPTDEELVIARDVEKLK